MPDRGRNQAGRAIVIHRVDSVRRQPIRQLDRWHHKGMYMPIAIYWQSLLRVLPPRLYYIPVGRAHFRIPINALDPKDISEYKFSVHSSAWNQVRGDSDFMSGACALSERMPPNTGVSALRFRAVRRADRRRVPVGSRPPRGIRPVRPRIGSADRRESACARPASGRHKRPPRLRRSCPPAMECVIPETNSRVRGGTRAGPRRRCPQMILGMMVR
jgi:hypothetical protein